MLHSLTLIFMFLSAQSVAPANSQRGFPAVVIGSRLKESKSKSSSSKRAKHAEEARRCGSVDSKMVFELIMDADEEDLNQKWIEGVTQARY